MTSTHEPLAVEATPATHSVSTALQWSIKRSFLRYIAAMPDGRCSVTDGADLAHGGEIDRFQYRFNGLKAGPDSLEAAFQGDVRFSGHHGMLFVRVADPLITVGSDGTGVLSVLPNASDTGHRVPLVTFTLTADDQPEDQPMRFTGTGVRLTADGADLFGGVYEASELVNDFDLTLPALDPVKRLGRQLA